MVDIDYKNVKCRLCAAPWWGDEKFCRAIVADGGWYRLQGFHSWDGKLPSRVEYGRLRRKFRRQEGLD